LRDLKGYRDPSIANLPGLKNEAPEMTAPIRTLQVVFPGLKEEEARNLLEQGEIHEYPAGTVLCQEDAYEATFYIILRGKVLVTKQIAIDQQRTLQILDAGDFFGEMAMIHKAPRAATVTTIEPTRVIEIYKEAFDQLLSSSASVARAMVQEVSRRLRDNDAMAIEDLRLKAGELALAYQRLAEQEYSRHEFLSTIAHELRTPLTAANGFLQMVQQGLMHDKSLDTELQQAALHSASRNLQQIINLVNDILFIQEMDLILPRFEPTDLKQALMYINEALERQAQDCQVRVVLDIPDDLPAVMGDLKSLERASAAILDNALKFSQPGGVVWVSARQEQDKLSVVIRDQGVGIAEELLPRIFDRFFHIDQIEDRLYRGVGLGLSIARQVIEQHRGSIQVASVLGQGTTVTLRLPVAAQA
jgi:signal transduction histidine kinase